MRGDSLPHDHPQDRNRGDENADSKNDPPRALALAQNSRTHDEKLITVVNQLLPVGCVFLAAICFVIPSASEGSHSRSADHTSYLA